MSVQTTYRHATPKGVAGGIVDMFYYQIDSRFNAEQNGVLRCGVGVVPGDLPGSNIKLPGAEAKADQFEGVVVNGFTQQHDLEGHVFVANNQNVGLMRRGRIWVRLAEGAAPKYGDPLHMIVDADATKAGLFHTEGGVEIPGRFLGAAQDGIAQVELFGTVAPAAGE